MMRDLKGLQWKAYTKANVDSLPTGQKGVYFLRSRGEVVLVGSSASGFGITDRLLAHLKEKRIQSHPDPLEFAYITGGFAMRPEAAEAFFIDLLGGKNALKFNSLMTGAKSLKEVLSVQSFSECPLCNRPW
jgi:hypothetical protein